MSNDLFAGIGVVPGTFLLPRPDANWTAWACVACDQYTSEPEYWQRVNTLVGHQPSTLRLILPECDLPAPPERIDAIHAAMRDALNVLHPGVTDGFALLERTTSTGKRLGLVCCVDLEQYRYDGAKTLIRPTEETVASRLPARLAVRNGAPLESSHVMLLLDDPQRTVIEPLYARRDQLSPLYDFDLMQQSGHARGWAVTSDADKAAIAAALNRLKDALGADPLLFAVGDGNHSLATAKKYYEQLKATLPAEEAAVHPARYAMVELVNIHDDALIFEPVHRVLTNVHPADVLADWSAYCAAHGMALSFVPPDADAQELRVVSASGEQTAFIAHPDGALPVATLQRYLDDFLRHHPEAAIDYIHGDEVLRRLSRADGAMGFLLPALNKADFFPAIEQLGILPRKTFSMGHAHDKRFYIECRKIL